MDSTPKRILGLAVVALAIGGLVTYAFVQSKEYLRGPVLSIEEPRNGFTATTSHIAVRGSAHNAAFLTFNGRQIFTDEQGRFSESLLLPEGYSIHTLEAKDRFGHTETKRLELVYKPTVSLPSLDEEGNKKGGVDSVIVNP